MKELKERILRDGRHLGNGILKVDSFLTHQVDLALMMRVGQELARRFWGMGVTKVLTAEISGIAPAVLTAYALGVPVIYARKHKPITMPEKVYHDSAPSHTKGGMVEMNVSPEFLGKGERVLIIDDFLASGQTIAALVRIVKQSGATLVGIGCVVEKTFEGGRSLLVGLGAPIESLAIIESMTGDEIVFSS
jgi:xanthine phosphoribosyltransferase